MDYTLDKIIESIQTEYDLIKDNRTQTIATFLAYFVAYLSFVIIIAEKYGETLVGFILLFVFGVLLGFLMMKFTALKMIRYYSKTMKEQQEIINLLRYIYVQSDSTIPERDQLQISQVWDDLYRLNSTHLKPYSEQYKSKLINISIHIRQIAYRYTPEYDTSKEETFKQHLEKKYLSKNERSS